MAFAALLAVSTAAQAQTLTTFVSNTNQTLDNTTGKPIYAQSFETGDSVGGYSISTVQVRLGVSSGATTRVRIKENNASNRPGDLVAELMNPGNLGSGLNTFTAPPGTRLDPSTTYWITVNEGVSNRWQISRTASDAETGEPGWSIGNGYLVLARKWISV